MNGKIYIIRNDVNDKVYIGQTKRSIEKRFQEHTTLTEAKRSLVLARAIQKYGADKFHVELLQDVGKGLFGDLVPLDGCLLILRNHIADRGIDFLDGSHNALQDELLQDGLTSTEALDAAEIRYIKEFGSVAPNGYNVTEGGLGHDPLVVDEALVLDYLSGLSIRAVAEKHGCSASKVKKHVLASGNKMRTNNNKFSAHASSLSEEALRDLFEVQGLTDSEISEKLGFSMRWIRRKRQQFGIHRI